ncbi:MAG: protein-export chaperone SecB [Alphaproteobacteria bacterium]|nr:protein-export chaperone SecB [Alphaproteobacteria bacterium]
MEDNKNSENTNQVALMIHSQYIKDMSIEIPMAPQIFAEMNQAPNVHIDISMGNRKLEDNNYEVTLTAKMDADIKDKKLFIVEITYGAVATVNVPEEHFEPIMYIELPRLLFPFVRSIVANSLSAAGLPAMLISPIDFVAMYNAKKAKEAENAANNNKKEGE